MLTPRGKKVMGMCSNFMTSLTVGGKKIKNYGV